jgi:dipeptidyl aminopeptidase/acylaminoacyl peptidase
MNSDYEDGYHSIVSVRFATGSSDRVIANYLTVNGSKGSTSYVSSSAGSWAAAETAKQWIVDDHRIDANVKQSFKDPPVLVATDRISNTSRIILDPNPQLKDVDLGDVSVFQWKDKNGRDWIGGLYKPSAYIRGQSYPLVIQTHGFSRTEFRPGGPYATAFAAQELAASGILVLQVEDCPYSQSPDEGPCNVAGYEAAVEQLASKGIVDPNRVGIVGFSRTCYYVMEALTTSTLHFKAASITDGVTQSYLQYITDIDTGGGAAPDMNAVIGARPFGAGLQLWFKRSPEFNMDKVTTPLQVVTSGRPYLVFMWEAYASLRLLNKPVDLILLAEDTHVLTNPAVRMASQGGTVDWFLFWLKGEENPDPAKAEQYKRWRGLRELQQQDDNEL